MKAVAVLVILAMVAVSVVIGLLTKPIEQPLTQTSQADTVMIESWACMKTFVPQDSRTKQRKRITQT